VIRAGSALLLAACALYFLSFVLQLRPRSVTSGEHVRGWKPFPIRWASVIASNAFALHTVGIVLRGWVRGTLPVTNTYESLVFYGWVFVVATLILRTVLPDTEKPTEPQAPDRSTIRPTTSVEHLIMLAGRMTPAVLIAIASSPLVPADVGPASPALQSHWLWAHVGLVFVGEGFLFVAFVASVLLLLPGSSRRYSAGRLDAIAYRAVVIGFPLFTLGGLLFGAIWAKHAWGRYWGWDPKETLMFVTWLAYGLYLVLRTRLGWRGRQAAWLCVAGFALALFTFVGANFLMPGLHGYT